MTRADDSDRGSGRLLEYNGRPTNMSQALREVAAWLDVADRFIDEAFRARGQERPNPGDDVQRDLMHLAEWFAAYPGASLSAAAYLRNATEPAAEGPCPRCGGDHSWCQTVRDDEYAS